MNKKFKAINNYNEKLKIKSYGLLELFASV